jgi:site-specific DNA-cytosine methylase
MNVVELFAGAGGMAEGLRRAGLAVTQAFECDAHPSAVGPARTAA